MDLCHCWKRNAGLLQIWGTDSIPVEREMIILAAFELIIPGNTWAKAPDRQLSPVCPPFELKIIPA